MTSTEQRLIDATIGREACYTHHRETNAVVMKTTNARADVYKRAGAAADKAYAAIVDLELLHATDQENPTDVTAARENHQAAFKACQQAETEYKAALKALLEEEDD